MPEPHCQAAVPGIQGSADSRDLHVAFVSVHDPDDPGALSGMPWRMRDAIAARVRRVSAFSTKPSPPASVERLLPPVRSAVRLMPASVRSLRRRAARLGTLARWRALPGVSTRRAHTRAAEDSRRLEAWLDQVAPDVVFGCCISTLLAGLRTRIPIVYFSDATARLINTSYPAYAVLGAAYARFCDRMESAALRSVTLAAFASEEAAASAIRDYGRDPASTSVISMGAHVTPSPERLRSLDPRPPTRENVELCIVASDARRKRLDVAVAATERLCRDGIAATLNVVGETTRRARRSKAVRAWGVLRLKDPVDRDTHESVLERSHFMLLPSLGEAFGIAPCEAAHFGRPSIVSDAGGLPSVVLNGVSGVLLPASAGAAEYARVVREIIDDPRRYLELSRGALCRARTILNWDAWADRIVELLSLARETRLGGCGPSSPTRTDTAAAQTTGLLLGRPCSFVGER